MKVLALITYRVFPTLMGGQKGIVLFYNYLQQHADVELIVSKNNKKRNVPKNAHPVLHANKTIFFNIFLYGVLKKLVRKLKPDVIIAEHSYAGWMAFLLRRTTGVPFIIHSHNLETIRFQEMKRWWWKWYEPYERWIHQKADFNFFISEADEAYALKRFGLDAAKCTTVTYGVEMHAPPELEKEAFLKHTGIWENEKVLYFNGTLDYKPNADAVVVLLNKILPLLQKADVRFKLLVTGNRATSVLKKQLMLHPDVVFLEWIPDVSCCYRSAQLFLNPIVQPSGVKTKVIEAIGNHCTVISTEAGASGINKHACGEKLITVSDGDWEAFTQKILLYVKQPQRKTGPAFFETYLWNNIAAKAVKKLQTVALYNERK